MVPWRREPAPGLVSHMSRPSRTPEHRLLERAPDPGTFPARDPPLHQAPHTGPAPPAPARDAPVEGGQGAGVLPRLPSASPILRGSHLGFPSGQPVRMEGSGNSATLGVSAAGVDRSGARGGKQPRSCLQGSTSPLGWLAATL